MEVLLRRVLTSPTVRPARGRGPLGLAHLPGRLVRLADVAADLVLRRPPLSRSGSTPGSTTGAWSPGCNGGNPWDAAVTVGGSAVPLRRLAGHDRPARAGGPVQRGRLHRDLARPDGRRDRVDPAPAAPAAVVAALPADQRGPVLGQPAADRPGPDPVRFRAGWRRSGPASRSTPSSRWPARAAGGRSPSRSSSTPPRSWSRPASGRAIWPQFGDISTRLQFESIEGFSAFYFPGPAAS